MAAPPKNLGRKELDLLRFIADRQPVTVREVATHAAETWGLARTTVLTMMERLREKKFLERRKVGGVYVYASRLPRDELLRGLVSDFVDRVLGGSLGPFVAYLANSEGVKEEDLEELGRLVRELEKRR
jgi:predicted transcriptional regulator